MFDRIIYSAWRIIILSLIFGLGVAGTFLMYQGLLAGLAMRFTDAAIPFAIGILMAAAVYWIARNRNDLVYS